MAAAVLATGDRLYALFDGLQPRRTPSSGRDKLTILSDNSRIHVHAFNRRHYCRSWLAPYCHRGLAARHREGPAAGGLLQAAIGCRTRFLLCILV